MIAILYVPSLSEFIYLKSSSDAQRNGFDERKSS